MPTPGEVNAIQDEPLEVKAWKAFLTYGAPVASAIYGAVPGVAGYRAIEQAPGLIEQGRGLATDVQNAYTSLTKGEKAVPSTANQPGSMSPAWQASNKAAVAANRARNPVVIPAGPRPQATTPPPEIMYSIGKGQPLKPYIPGGNNERLPGVAQGGGLSMIQGSDAQQLGMKTNRAMAEAQLAEANQALSYAQMTPMQRAEVQAASRARGADPIQAALLQLAMSSMPGQGGENEAIAAYQKRYGIPPPPEYVAAYRKRQQDAFANAIAIVQAMRGKQDISLLPEPEAYQPKP